MEKTDVIKKAAVATMSVGYAIRKTSSAVATKGNVYTATAADVCGAYHTPRSTARLAGLSLHEAFALIVAATISLHTTHYN